MSEREWELIREQTIIGQRILSAAPALQHAALFVRSSHERYDGAGYPDGLAADEIPLESRIIAVADAFDAMTSPRPYQAARTETSALLELRRCAGTQFDPQVVTAFAAALAEDQRMNLSAA